MRLPLPFVPAVATALVFLAGRALFAAAVTYRVARAERLLRAGAIDESGRVIDRVQLEVAARRVRRPGWG